MTWVTCLLTHFPYPCDYKKHTYLAIPEVSVLKEGEGTPVEAHSEAIDVSLPTDLIAGPVEARSEAMDHTTPPDVTESVRAVDSTRSATAAESQPQPTHPLPPHPVSQPFFLHLGDTSHQVRGPMLLSRSVGNYSHWK